MPVFEPITKPEQLPPEQVAYETAVFDMKKQVKRKAMDDPTSSRVRFDKFEMAKDVAAFANSLGGTILIGAAEDKARGVLGKYFPMTEADTKELKDAYGEAVKERCSPAPLLDANPIQKDGGFVLAVNVWPFPGQPVAVMLRGDKTDGYGDPAWVFFHRVGDDAKPIKPEQLAMLMIPELRRKMILVDSIPQSSRSLLYLFSANGNNMAVIGLTVHPVGHSISLRLNSGAVNAWFEIPLDAVKFVWKEPNGTYHISIAGSVDEQGKFYPPRLSY